MGKNFSHRIRTYLLSLVFVTVGFFFHTETNAAHIVGGDVRYECLGYNSDTTSVRLRIILTIYRDAFTTGANFDANARLGVFRGSGNFWNYYDEASLPFEGSSDVPIEDDPCVEIPSGIGVESATYTYVDWFPIIGQSYQFVYQRCCRNGTIFNIQNPGSTGAAYSVEVTPEAQLSCNNSPEFKDFPPVFICAGQNLEFDHGATDVEGDIIVYSFCAPLTSGGTDGATTPGDPNSCTGVTPAPTNCPPPYDLVSFVQPAYSPTNPMGGSPQISINPSTGVITGVPDLVGQYVVGVCAAEFRNGVKIGEIRRDFQFNVTNCTPLVVADIASDSIVAGVQQEYIINSCGETTVFFENLSYDQANIQSNIWSFDTDNDGVLETSTDWDATFTFPGVGEYFGTLILNPGSAQCSDTATIYLNIYPSITADYNFAYDTCVAGPVAFNDQSFTGADNLVRWSWDFNGEDSSEKQNPNHLFATPGLKQVGLVVEDNNGCRDTLVQEVDWRPVPPLLIIEPSSFIGCAPAQIFFNNLSSPIDSTYIITWEFGDGEMGTDISPYHEYQDVGVYSVNVEVTSPIGCKTEKFFPNWIRVEPSPTADFYFSPEEPSVFNPLVQFTDNSDNAISWQWNFNGEGTSFQPNPTYEFQDTGQYEVQLVVLHPSGCPDTITKIIDVEPKVTFFMPNAFTPNNDGQNDTFLGKGFVDGMQEFSMTIWNRWGERIYDTDDPFSGWNGTKNNVGEQSPTGVYVYHVNYIDPRGERVEISGHTTLIR